MQPSPRLLPYSAVLSRGEEARCACAPLRPQAAIKAEVSFIESIESVDLDDGPDIKLAIPFNPRQVEDPLQLQVAALKLAPSSSSLAEDLKVPEAPGPSRFADPWGIRGAHLCHIPDGDLGPADPPRRRSQPKGSKSRPRVAFTTATLPERQEQVKAEERLANMASSKR